MWKACVAHYSDKTTMPLKGACLEACSDIVVFAWKIRFSSGRKSLSYHLSAGTHFEPFFGMLSLSKLWARCSYGFLYGTQEPVLEFAPI